MEDSEYKVNLVFFLQDTLLTHTVMSEAANSSVNLKNANEIEFYFSETDTHPISHSTLTQAPKGTCLLSKT